jgi:hypothetical protein
MCSPNFEKDVYSGIKNTRKVTFLEGECCSISDIRSIPSLSELSLFDISSQWLSREDFETSKSTTKLIAMQARQSAFNDLLKYSFIYDISTTTGDPLLKWCRHGQLRRGLEQSVSPQHGEERRLKRKMAIHAVLRAQDLFRSDKMIKNDITDQLATVSRKFTLNARLFAQRMGEADAIAAQVEPITRENEISRRRRAQSFSLSTMNKNDSASSMDSVVLCLSRSLSVGAFSTCNSAA